MAFCFIKNKDFLRSEGKKGLGIYEGDVLRLFGRLDFLWLCYSELKQYFAGKIEC